MHNRRHVVCCCDFAENFDKNRLLEKLKDELGSKSDIVCCFIQARLEQDQFVCSRRKDETLKWYPVIQTEIDETVTNDCDEDRELVSVAETLHEVADSLPFTGSLVDVIVEVTGDIIQSDVHLTLWGALRRLKDWHNAAITMVTDSNTLDTRVEGSDMTVRKLQTFLGADLCNCLEDVKFNKQLDWRGKISVVDKTVNKGFILPGFELQSKTDECPVEPRFTYPGHYNQKQTMDMDNSAILGRMLEVLDEVDVHTVPSFMLTNNRYTLSLYHKHPHSEPFMDHIACSNGTGVLMRLPCYPQSPDIPVCGDKYLSTSSWKESVMADITFVQEPEEELQDKCEFLYFLVTSAAEDGLSDQLIVHQLRSPYELDGSIIYHLYHHSVLPRSNDYNDRDITQILSDLPEFQDTILQQIHKDLEDIQTQLLQEWLDTHQSQGKRTVVKSSDIYSFLAETQQIFLDNFVPHLPKSQELDDEIIEIQKNPKDLDLNPTEWPERKYLIYQESQKRSLSRLQSTESMALSSPIQPSETKSTIDVKDFLKLFKVDGTSTVENLSPVRKRHPSRSQTRVIDQNQENVVQSSWPDSFDLCRYPDIYYNRGKKREKLETHFNKLRDRYVTAETYSSCSSPKVVFPNKTKAKSNQNSTALPKKKKPGLLSPRRSPRKSVSMVTMSSPRRSPRKSVTKTTMLSPRRSPRKKARRQFQSGDFSDARKAIRLSSDSSELPIPKHLLLDGDTKRRHSLSSLPADTLAKPDPRRLSTSLVPKDGKRKTSMDESDLDDSINKKVSRSERHKRRLEEICSDVLLSKGVDKENPIFTACASKLYKVTKLFVMDLPTSRNLKEEMKKIATDQVQHVIDVETRRQSLSSDGGASQSKRQRKT